jgi:23S rRNA (cytidine1920-2'-O)/16S rRNA (cytidine1409-2'-O)-methyltransferase
MKSKERVDVLVFSRGLASSRQKAQALIMAGRVSAEGRRVEKPGERLDPEINLSVSEGSPYVSRGGLKLAEALDAFGVTVQGKVAADLGSSTGGFTDCLLQRGARLVYAVDVSVRQIDWNLLRDSRVVLIEKNARYLEPGDFQERPSIMTMDLSFISVLKILPAVREIMTDGDVLVLLKPQFEAGRGQVGKKGVVRDPARHEEVLNRLLEGAGEMGFGVLGLHGCTVLGKKGNREFFVHWASGKPSRSLRELRTLISEVVHEEKD